MQDFLLSHYQFIKALHIVSVMAWIAGMLYLPRLFVYHVEASLGGELSETLKIMEARLLRIIMNPAMISAWSFGVFMLWANPSLFKEGWLHIKLGAIILMTVLHHVYARWRKDFLKDDRRYSSKTYRLWNEAPAVLMIIIVFMAVLKPF